VRVTVAWVIFAGFAMSDACSINEQSRKCQFAVAGVDLGVIQAPKPEACFMRYEITNYEWAAIRPFLSNKPRVNDRRVHNGIFWVLRLRRAVVRSVGSFWPPYDLLQSLRSLGKSRCLGPDHGCIGCNSVQMIDTSIVRMHQHGACIAGNNEQHMGRSRGGLTTKIHVVVGLPVQLGLTSGEAHDNLLCSVLLSGLQPRTMSLADRGYDADWIRALARQQSAWANIPPKRNRNEPICLSLYLYLARNLVEGFFNKIKQCRRIATRYDKLAAN
jgi:transposase